MENGQHRNVTPERKSGSYRSRSYSPYWVRTKARVKAVWAES